MSIPTDPSEADEPRTQKSSKQGGSMERVANEEEKSLGERDGGEIPAPALDNEEARSIVNGDAEITTSMTKGSLLEDLASDSTNESSTNNKDECLDIPSKHSMAGTEQVETDDCAFTDRSTPRDSGRVIQLDAIEGAEVSPVRSEFWDAASPQVGSAASETMSISRHTEELPSLHEHARPSYEGIQEGDGITPPMPAHLFQSNHEQAQNLPRARTSPATTQHGRESPGGKAAVRGYHARQSSYNPYNTTQISHNRERVRYSWQSFQEDTPDRPRIHIIKLVSNTTSASSAFPGGEAFGFSISPSGRRIAAYDSSRLYIIQTAALPVGISQDFSLKRRPLAVELTDGGNVVAILADEHTINIYDLSNSRSRRVKTFKLDFPANCIAIAPSGGLIAAAYEGGIEVFSLAATALNTDRRAVRAPRMDKLTFSEDGSALLGTTTRIHASSTVLISVPVFPAAETNVPTAEELKMAWCSELLHPENIRNSSHAVFMREERKTVADKLFAWNGQADTFGIMNTSDMAYGNAEFPIIIQPPLSTCGGLGAAIHSCPSIDEFGETVAMIVNDRTIRLYVVPPKVDDSDEPVEAHSIDHELDEGYGCPFSELRWVYSHSSLPAPGDTHSRVKGRLVVTSPGSVYGQEVSEESFEEPEGGRIILFDFDPQFAGQPGQTFYLNLGKSPPLPLEEEQYDVADAVALVRRRTVKQNKANDLNQRPLSIGRAATSAGTSRRGSRAGYGNIPSRQIEVPVISAPSQAEHTNHGLADLVEGVEAMPEFDEPFSMTAPRSQVSLQRAASNVQRHRFQTLEEREQEGVSTEGHNGNFLALPEYTEEPNAPLPGKYRAMAGLDVPLLPRALQSNTDLPTTIAGESLVAEEAFALANATLAAGQSSAGMPRGLLRAYSNAASPGVQQLSSRSYAGDRPGMLTYRSLDQRYSTNLAGLMEVQPSGPRRSSSSRRPGEHVYGLSSRGSDRQVYAAASLFPQMQSSDHVPLPLNRQAIGGIAHPVTSWRPPAASQSQSQPQSAYELMRAQSRRSSVANRHAFPSTARAKKLGFFKRSRPSPAHVVQQDRLSVVDHSRATTNKRPGSESKCSVM